MATPEIARLNNIRWCVAMCDRRWNEALAQLRAAAAEPDYSGPPIATIELIGEAIANVKGFVGHWSTEEKLKAVMRKRGLPRGPITRKMIRETICGR